MNHAGNWVRFACPIPHWFVVNCNLPMINDRANWLRFALFRPPQAPFPPDSRTTIHSPLASPPTFHAPRSSGVRRRCRAPSWVQHSPPGKRQYATHCYVFGFSAEVWRAWFSAQLNIEIGLTSFSLLTLVSRDSRPNCLPKKELRRNEPRSRFPQSRHFEPISGRFTPPDSQISAKSGSGGPLLGTRETRMVPTVPLATVLLTPHASRPHAPRSTLHAPRSTLHAPRSTLHAPRSTLHAPRSTLHAPRSTLHAPRSTLHAPRSTLHAPRSTLHAPRSTLHASNSVRHEICRYSLTSFPL